MIQSNYIQGTIRSGLLKFEHQMLSNNIVEWRWIVSQKVSNLQLKAFWIVTVNTGNQWKSSGWRIPLDEICHTKTETENHQAFVDKNFIISRNL